MTSAHTAVRQATLRPRRRAVRPPQATRKAATLHRVLPDNGPTRSLYWSDSAKLSLALAIVVRIPSTRAPIPAASMTATTGPFGFSGRAAGGRGSTGCASITI
jgi:hypothetical protein